MIYLFVFDLTKTADTTHGSAARGPGRRAFEGFGPGGIEVPFRAARWLDSGEELALERDGAGRLVLNATGYPYGTNTVVRVARLEA